MSKKYMLGAYGCGNLGDEAIGMGIREVFGHDIIRVCVVDKPQSVHDISTRQFLATVEEGDHVTLGGGYNFRDDLSISIVLQQVRCIAEKGACISIRGGEIAPRLTPIAVEHIQEIFRLCDTLEFRTLTSVSYAQYLTNYQRHVCFHRDYSFDVRGDSSIAMSRIPFLCREFVGKKLIGVGFGGHSLSLYPLLAQIVDIFQDSVQFIGLPHCHHSAKLPLRDDRENLLKIDKLCKSTILIPKWEDLTSGILKGIYKILDGVVSGRLHSLLFALDCFKPVFVWGDNRMDAVGLSMALIAPDYDPSMATIVHEPNPLLIESFINEVLCRKSWASKLL